MSYVISHMIMPLISVLSDISGIRYHIFYDISAYVMVVPARRAGAGWGRQAPGAPPAPATPSPTCSGWGRVFNRTGTKVEGGTWNWVYPERVQGYLKVGILSSWKFSSGRHGNFELTNLCPSHIQACSPRWPLLQACFKPASLRLAVCPWSES